MIWTIGIAISWNELWKKCAYVILWDSHVEIVRIFSKKYLKGIQGDSFLFLFCHLFLKIRLTVAALSCLEYLFEDISLLLILAKWQAITFDDILTKFAEIPSISLALFTLSDLIIFIDVACACTWKIKFIFRDT